jgi:predicted DNA-binding transcriptional regulator AlpA
MNNPNDQKQEVTIETLPPLFDTKTLTTALGLTPAWAEHARWKGTGPNFIRVGGAVRYRRDDVLQWLEKGTRSSTFSISK